MCRTRQSRRGDMLPPFATLKWPVYLLWWSYVFLLALSPLPVLAQETLAVDGGGFLSNGCRWDGLTRKLNCSALGLTRVPYIHPNISTGMRQLNLVNNSLETLTVEDIKAFTEVTLLDLRSNKIRVIDDEVFSARYLPKLQQLFLSRNQLTRLPLNLFQFTAFTTLDLSHNNFKYPPPAIRNANHISNLLLNNNPFQGLQKDSFANMSSVVTLELSACNLTFDNIIPEVFSDFINLRTLYLDLNHFPYVQREIFASIPSVRDLYLQQCGIERIENRAFKDLNSLSGLHMSRNNISELFPNSFRDLNMITLDLRDCGIQNIRKGALRTKVTKKLYLSHNNITVLHDQDFKELQAVESIDLSYSGVTEIRGAPFFGLDHLQQLYLQHNNLEDEHVNVGKLNTSGKLMHLDLTGNKLTSIPDLNGKFFPYLNHLDVGNNDIAYITNGQLRNMTSLTVLILRENPLEVIENEAFMECWQVTDLNMDFTRIKRLPDMSNMAGLTDLHIVHSNLEYFPDDFCVSNKHLLIIEATANEIQRFTNFSGCRNLVSLALDYNEITEIPHGVLSGLTKLVTLTLHENQISNIARDVFNDLRKLRTLTLYHNIIQYLPEGIFSQLPALRKLNLGFNHIRKLPEGLFANNTLLSSLWLNDNDIDEVHPKAFPQLRHLEILNMSSNVFCSLEFPDMGFPSLHVLGLEQLWCLHNVPSPHTMPNAQEIYYTYAYHCCLWEDTLNSDIYENDEVLPTTVPPHNTEEITLPPGVLPIPPDSPFEKCTTEGVSPEGISDLMDFLNQYNLTITWGPDCRFMVEGNPLNMGRTAEDIARLRSGQPTTLQGDNNIVVGTNTEEFFNGVNEFRNHYVSQPTSIPWNVVTCLPRPNPLTPCDNLLDPWPIRVAIWAVWVLTLLGNISVLFIMIAARQGMDVSQFFICVLAFSNTLLGIYLAFIAMVDIRTLGDRSFYQSALEWQKGSGCQTAGFLAIFSSQLSVYISVILTIERLHHVVTSTATRKGSKKRRLAVLLIFIGVLYASTLAVLPLNGMELNSYDEVAICLPFASKTPEDRNYILTLLSLNMLGILLVMIAFLTVFFCLFRPSLSRKKRCEVLTSTMKLSLLMVTTFLCWFPIGVVGYSSVLQEPIINAEQAKYFIVFVFPVNSLFSPVIYALITRSFRKSIWWIVTCCPSTKNKDTPMQTFRLVQRLATSTPSSLMSSDPPPCGQSPGLTGEELRVLRQSRRSNSYSVQFNPNQQQCLTPPTPGSITRMGRRASLPAVFESNTADKHSECSAEQSIIFPFRLAPGLLSQMNSSLPNLPEENENEEADIPPDYERANMSPLRHECLSTAPESNKIKKRVCEVQVHSCINGITDEASYASPLCTSTSADKTPIASELIHTEPSKVTSPVPPEYRTPRQESPMGIGGPVVEKHCQKGNHQIFGHQCFSACSSHAPSPISCHMPHNLRQQDINSTEENSHYVEGRPSDSLNSAPVTRHGNVYSTTEKDGFEYARLQEQFCIQGRSKRLEVINPRFAALSPTQESETDV